jgi:hypothetical protein
VIAWLGQPARCARSEVLPPDYMTSNDAAYLPGIAPEDAAPVPPPTGGNGLRIPIVLAVAVVALFWRFRAP